MKNVLITGATSGIGEAAARVFSNKGYDLILVGRNKEKLEELREQYENAKIIECDLIENCDDLLQIITEEKIDILFNNAGFGDSGAFLDSNYKKQEDMVRLNIEALMKLCYYVGNEMKERGEGKILNVASIAAFTSGPYMSIYYATKAFVLSFSEALHEELKDYGVSVTCLCPGPTKTKFMKTAHLKDSVMWKYFPPASANEVAKYGVKSLLANRYIAIHGLSGHLLNIASRVLPRKYMTRMVAHVNKKR